MATSNFFSFTLCTMEWSSSESWVSHQHHRRPQILTNLTYILAESGRQQQLAVLLFFSTLLGQRLQLVGCPRQGRRSDWFKVWGRWRQRWEPYGHRENIAEMNEILECIQLIGNLRVIPSMDRPWVSTYPSADWWRPRQWIIHHSSLSLHCDWVSECGKQQEQYGHKCHGRRPPGEGSQPGRGHRSRWRWDSDIIAYCATVWTHWNWPNYSAANGC